MDSFGQLELMLEAPKPCGCAKAHVLCQPHYYAIAKSVHGFGAPRLYVRIGEWRKLTRAQRQVVARIYEGLNNRQIASALGLNRKTVRNHLTAAYRKFNALDRFELIQRISYEFAVVERPAA